MKTFLSLRFLIIAFLVPLALFAEPETTESVEHALVDEMLLKPTVIDVTDHLAETEPTKDLEQPSQSFLGNLQANLGGINLPTNVSQGDSAANTWIPKFVWIGDVKQSDDLKCFAAFLIGSLADKDNPSSQANPGMFMTPVTTTTQAAQPIAAVNSENLTARSSRSAPPPPMPANSRMFAEFDVGLGFLYFSGARGNLIPVPNILFKQTSGIDSTGGVAQSQTLRGPIQYNRTPVCTVDFGWRLSNWVDFGYTMQAQQGVHIRTQPFQFAYALQSGEPILVITNFQSDLDLYSVGGKLMFHWADMIKYRNWTMSLYLGGSAGGAWQSWTKVTAVQTSIQNEADLTSSNISLRSQYYANLSYTGDAGLIFKPTNIFAKMSFRMGCKFIGWGSTRGLGNIKDQTDIFNNGSTASNNGDPTNPSLNGRFRPGYFKPIRLKAIYSWTPYIGFKFEF